MFLLEPQHTAYDLHFRVAGIPVRVHPMFWLIGAIMGFSTLHSDNPFASFAIWMGCMFVSILIHEMGHVIVGQLFGSRGHIVLYAFGGLAIPDRRLHERWQRIAVSFAGPFAQFLLLALVGLSLAIKGTDYFLAFVHLIGSFFGLPMSHEDVLALRVMEPMVLELVLDMTVINLFWALLNLLPIFPLDGGQISRELFEAGLPGVQGTRASLILSIVVAAALAVHAIASTRGIKLIPFLPGLGMYSAVMFGMLAVQNFQMLQQVQEPPWRRDEW
jgi:Zn-dependent protease